MKPRLSSDQMIADRKHRSLREIVEQIAKAALDQAPFGRPMHDDTIAPIRMLQHLGRQQLMDQLIRSVEQCEYERRAREGMKKVARWSEDVKVITRKTEDDRNKR
jgi:hypothetical protein